MLSGLAWTRIRTLILIRDDQGSPRVVAIVPKAFWHTGFQLSVGCVVDGRFSSFCGRGVDAEPLADLKEP